MDHTFAICAYQESEYLERCIRSLKGQTLPSRIILVTHTPSPFLDETAKKYDLPLFVNPGPGGITQDWNFALSCIDTPYATIAHQDDVYGKNYLKKVAEALERSRDPLIFFTDYCELRNGRRSKPSLMLRIKKLLSFPLRFPVLRGSRFVRRRSLSLGNMVACPSVTYVMEKMPSPLFEDHFTSNEDWEAWEKLSRQKGEFVYIPKVLVAHRVHEASTTAEMIRDDRRTAEDYEMFRKFWPAFMAKAITRLYKKSEKYNGVDL